MGLALDATDFNSFFLRSFPCGLSDCYQWISHRVVDDEHHISSLVIALKSVDVSDSLRKPAARRMGRCAGRLPHHPMPSLSAPSCQIHDRWPARGEERRAASSLASLGVACLHLRVGSPDQMFDDGIDIADPSISRTASCQRPCISHSRKVKSRPPFPPSSLTLSPHPPPQKHPPSQLPSASSTPQNKPPDSPSANSRA